MSCPMPSIIRIRATHAIVALFFLALAPGNTFHLMMTGGPTLGHVPGGHSLLGATLSTGIQMDW
jgi:hypothetical protein